MTGPKTETGVLYPFLGSGALLEKTGALANPGKRLGRTIHHRDVAIHVRNFVPVVQDLYKLMCRNMSWPRFLIEK